MPGVSYNIMIYYIVCVPVRCVTLEGSVVSCSRLTSRDREQVHLNERDLQMPFKFFKAIILYCVCAYSMVVSLIIVETTPTGMLYCPTITVCGVEKQGVYPSSSSQ